MNPSCPRWLAAAVYSMVFASALAVVWSKHQSRQLFIELQQLQREEDKLYEIWSSLQIDYGTWGAHHRTEHIARERLQMLLPQEEVLVFVEREQ